MTVIGLLLLEVLIPQAQSLKQKRRIVKGLKDELHRTFNISIAEVGALEKWQRSKLAVACAGNEKRFVNSVLSKVVNVVEGKHELELIDYELELG